MVRLQARLCAVVTERNLETTQHNSSLNARSHCGGVARQILLRGKRENKFGGQRLVVRSMVVGWGDVVSPSGRSC